MNKKKKKCFDYLKWENEKSNNQENDNVRII